MTCKFSKIVFLLKIAAAIIMKINRIWGFYIPFLNIGANSPFPYILIFKK